MSLEEACANPAFPLPVGCIFPYMGMKKYMNQETFLWCNGSAVKKDDYPELYNTIGDRFRGSNVALSDSFYLPQLASVAQPTDDPVYLVPNPTVKTDANTPSAILTPTIHSSAALPGISSANIPALAASDFSQVQPSVQVGIAGRTLNGRGQNPKQATNTDGTATPRIVKLNASSETGATTTLDDMTISWSNPNPAAVGDIKLNADHEVNYGGMTCLYLIKARSSYKTGGNSEAIVAGAEQQQALKNSQAAEKSAYRQYINRQEAEAVQEAQDQEDAIADEGQGGGTTIEYEDVPQLSGFILDPNPQY